MAYAIVDETHHRAMSRSTIQRILSGADLQPHRSVYWLDSHDPDFDAKAKDICGLYIDAPRLYEQGRLVLCCDEKTGMQILQRKDPTRPLGLPSWTRRASRPVRWPSGATCPSWRGTCNAAGHTQDNH